MSERFKPGDKVWVWLYTPEDPVGWIVSGKVRRSESYSVLIRFKEGTKKEHDERISSTLVALKKGELEIRVLRAFMLDVEDAKRGLDNAKHRLQEFRHRQGMKELS